MLVVKMAVKLAFGSAEGSGRANPFRRIWLAVRTAFPTALAALSLVTLVGMLLSINVESTAGFTRYWDGLDYSHVVAQRDQDSEVYSTALPPRLVEEVQRQPGLEVSAVSLMFARYRDQDVIVMTWQGSGLAAPAVVAGRHPRRAGEVMFDQYLARDLGLRVGDVAELFGQHLKVVGLSSDTDSIGRRRLFLAPSAFAQIGGRTTQDLPANLLLVKGDPSPQLMHHWQSTHAFYTKARWLEGAEQYGWRNFTPLIYTMVVACVLLSVLSYANLMRSQAAHLRPFMAKVRLIGTTKTETAGIAALVLLLQAVLGMVAGVGAAWLMVRVTALTTPGFHASLSASTIAAAVLLTLGVTIVSGVAPLAWKFWRLSPMEAVRLQST